MIIIFKSILNNRIYFTFNNIDEKKKKKKLQLIIYIF